MGIRFDYGNALSICRVGNAHHMMIVVGIAHPTYISKIKY